jgi:hypothetical protein
MHLQDFNERINHSIKVIEGFLLGLGGPQRSC